MSNEKKHLDDKHRVFAFEYVKDFNGSRAAKVAGYAPSSAGQEASRLLKNVKVSAMIDANMKALKTENKVTMDWVIKELVKIAGADLREAYDDEGNILPVHLLPDNIAAALDGIEVVEMAGTMKADDKAGIKHVAMRTKKIKKISKDRALELLGRYFGGWKDNINHGGAVTVNHHFPEGYKPPEERAKT